MSRYQAELERHLEKYAGPIALRWENLLVVRACEGRACHIVVSTDLSDAPMKGAKSDWHFAEVCVLLPPDWPLDPEIWESDLDFGWPMREVQRIVATVREEETWLGFGHTFPNGQPPEPFAPGTGQCASFLLPPVEMPEKFTRLRLSDGEILNFWAIVPIYADELALKVNQKASMLVEKLTVKLVSDIIAPTRPGVFAKTKGPRTWKQRLLGR